jgi:type IV pilus assembly protein PilN
VIRRPNLASRPFLDTRPVTAVGVALAIVAIGLTTVSVADFLSERGEETQLAESVRELEARRATLLGEIATLDRQLARTPWKKLKAETASMQHLIVQGGSIWSTLFADLERVLPWDTRLLSIDPRSGETGEITVTLSGVAADRAAWLKLLGRLFTDSRFSDPIPRSEESPGERNAVGFTFVLSVRYWPEGRP